jgi:hypothetical protein
MTSVTQRAVYHAAHKGSLMNVERQKGCLAHLRVAASLSQQARPFGRLASRSMAYALPSIGSGCLREREPEFCPVWSSGGCCCYCREACQRKGMGQQRWVQLNLHNMAQGAGAAYGLIPEVCCPATSAAAPACLTAGGCSRCRFLVAFDVELPAPDGGCLDAREGVRHARGALSDSHVLLDI